jgi:ribosomal protein L40E
MKVIRILTIIAVFFVTWVLFIITGIMIGMAFAHSRMPVAEIFVGFLGGLVLGVPLAMGCAELFKNHVWPEEKRGSTSPTKGDHRQQQWEEEMLHPETAEMGRVEKYGAEIVICPACGTKNSLSFARCLKCSRDLSREQPVDNPYIA